MTRCNCSGSSCSCLLQAKDTQVTVTGTGTQQDPYIVGVGDVAIGGKLVVTAGVGVDLTQGGSGTTLDPKTLTVALHVGIDSVVVATTGQTQTPTADARTLKLTPAGTIATQTITLPSTSTALGSEIVIVTTQTITALTVNPAAGVTVSGAPTTLTANQFVRFRLVGTVWTRVG